MAAYIIRHDETGDEAEATSREAAFLAARTLLDDNDGGLCRVYRGDTVVEMMWRDAGDDQYQYLFGTRGQ